MDQMLKSHRVILHLQIYKFTLNCVIPDHLKSLEFRPVKNFQKQTTFQCHLRRNGGGCAP
ncbi:hypothetical protein BpHYR1_037055 [Brachionus plicatilis]|uniref:Uncharacterized protein n=1 Tax=Brachionus plicatilis TaxID=10195 RepID=A0A3M7SN49_BRAPC|nr:hypothetical protein BpHYR1_037055 [Brachionus plicatilis]